MEVQFKRSWMIAKKVCDPQLNVCDSVQAFSALSDPLLLPEPIWLQ